MSRHDALNLVCASRIYAEHVRANDGVFGELYAFYGDKRLVNCIRKDRMRGAEWIYKNQGCAGVSIHLAFEVDQWMQFYLRRKIK